MFKNKFMMLFDADTGGGGGSAVDSSASQNNQDSSDSSKSNNANNNTDDGKKSSDVDIERIIQSAVDRATNKLGNENKNLRKQIENLKTQHMTEDELKQEQLQTKETELAEREAKLLESENRLYAISAIKKIGLDNGDETSLQLIDIIMDKDQKKIDAKLAALKGFIDKQVAAEVDKTFRKNGRNPNGSTNDDSSSNNANDSIATKIGKSVAERNTKTNSVLKHYGIN